MDIWYWMAEFGKVLLGYLFFLYLWPSVVFGKHLKGKSLTYGFSFCVTVPLVIANTIVLMLGMFHILDSRVIVVLFYGVFVVSFLRRMIKEPVVLKRKELWKRCRLWLADFRVHMLEYGVLSILLLFGIMYFSYGAFQVHSYGFGDLYTHHAWIYGLKEGHIFAGGIYLEAMHCFVYCLNVLFGIRVYSILLFLQGMHISAFLLAGYLLLREIFHWHYTPLLALTLFLTLDVVSADLIYGMFRLQITLPLEFGLHTQFLCALYLLRYLKSTHRVEKKGGISRYYWDDNLLLFMISLAASVSIHFYSTIMAVILCACFAVFLFRKLFEKEHLIPLMVSVLCACTVAIFPLAGALASGIPFNPSLYWAAYAMDGEETRKLEEKSSLEGALIQEKPHSVFLYETMKGVYEEGYVALYGTKGAYMILLATGAGVIICLFSQKKAFSWLKEISGGYPPLILFTILFVLLYVAPRLGYPEIISDSRFCSTGHMMLMALMMLPMDVAFSLLSQFCREVILKTASLLAVVAIYGWTRLTGHYHGYLFYELSRYDAAVEVTNLIIENFPEKSYVIVSPTDELYQVIEHGWHEELLAFVENIGNAEYTFTADHVFIYVEKKPLQYAQAYFFEGPSWLAEMKYKDVYWNKYKSKYPDTGATQAPKINTSEISEEVAQADLIDYGDPWLSYIRLPSRTILEAKAYSWSQKFLELYPEKIEIYYEDDAFICYHLRPNGGLMHNLEIE